MNKTIILASASLALAGCGSQNSSKLLTTAQELPPIAQADQVIVKARASFPLVTGTTRSQAEPTFDSLLSATPGNTSGTVPVNVVNSASTSMSLDSSQFVVPTISNALLDFGYLNISELKDNNLNLCGTDSKHHCGTALIRIYTVGTAGPGLYNPTDDFGAPITAGLPGTTLGTVGLDVSNAAIVQSITLPGHKHTIKLSDFSPTPHYDVKADFTDAGAGSYSTTLVVEYGLAP